MRHFCATDILVDEANTAVLCSSMYWLLDGQAEVCVMSRSMLLTGTLAINLHAQY